MTATGQKRKNTPVFEVINPTTGEVDLQGAMLHVLSTFRADPRAEKREGGCVIRMKLNDEMARTGIELAKHISLYLLMQEVGLIRRLGKDDRGGQYLWWFADESLALVLTQPDLLEEAKRRELIRRRKFEELNQLRKRMADEPVPADTSSVGEKTLDQIAEMVVDRDEALARVVALETEVATLKRQLAERPSADEALAAAIAAVRTNRGGKA